MDIVVRQQILKEINFILKSSDYLEEGIGDFASEKWNEFKKESSYLGKELGLTAKNLAQGDTSRLKQLGKAVTLGLDDIQTLYEKDPRAFWQSVGDLISLIDPTGLADLINAGVYLYHGEKTMGIISLITGGLTAVGAIGSIAGGAGLPIIVLGKTIKTIKIAKEGSKLFSVCEKLATFFPKILAAIRTATHSMPALKPVESEALGFFGRLQKALSNKAGFENFDAMFNYLFGGGKLESAIKTINSAEFSKSAQAVSQGINQVAGAGFTATNAAEMGQDIRERQEIENIIKNSSLCKYKSCATIYYDKKTNSYMDSQTGKADNFFLMAYNIQYAKRRGTLNNKKSA